MLRCLKRWFPKVFPPLEQIATHTEIHCPICKAFLILIPCFCLLHKLTINIAVWRHSIYSTIDIRFFCLKSDKKCESFPYPDHWLKWWFLSSLYYSSLSKVSIKPQKIKNWLSSKLILSVSVLAVTPITEPVYSDC